jgi:hypothetical protein
MGGIIWGEKTINIEGSMTFLDVENCIKAVIFFGCGKKNDEY